MADFAQFREALRDARNTANAAEDAAAAARERLARIDAALQALARVRGGDAQRERLQAERERAQAALAESNATKVRMAAAVLDATRAFAAFTDPREGIRRLDDRIPILMMPVRLETRFGPVKGDGPDAHR